MQRIFQCKEEKFESVFELLRVDLDDKVSISSIQQV